MVIVSDVILNNWMKNTSLVQPVKHSILTGKPPNQLEANVNLEIKRIFTLKRLTNS
jgi:hypothetical protein